MKLCSHHNNGLMEALTLVGLFRDYDALFQAQSLILQNAMNEAPELLRSPPTVCPICRLAKDHPRLEAEWTTQAALSIAKERNTR